MFFMLSLFYHSIPVYGQSSKDKDPILTQDQINYIYERAFDLFMTHKRISLDNDNMPFNTQVIPFDSITFLWREERIPILRHVYDSFNLETSIPLGTSFNPNHSSIINLYSIEYIQIDRHHKFREIQNMLRLRGNIALLEFSDIYKKDSYFFLSANVNYFISDELYSYPASCTFQIELCQDKIPIFRLAFNPASFSFEQFSRDEFIVEKKDCK